MSAGQYRDDGGWNRASRQEVRVAWEADYAVPESQYYAWNGLSPADWTLDDVRMDGSVEIGGEG